MKRDTTSASFFEEKYKQQGDPWNFAGSPYERHRYDVTFAALAHRTYDLAFEPGCSVGVLTEKLAILCRHVDAMDISPTAVEQALVRCHHLPNVEITCAAFPYLIPGAPLDLVVLSEIGYYLPEDQLNKVGTELVSRLSPHGVLLAVHWLGHSEDHLLSGDRVHELLHGLDGLVHQHAERHTGFRLDRWVRR